MDLTTKSTTELVAMYNAATGKTIKKFETRSIAEKRVAEVLAKSGLKEVPVNGSGFTLLEPTGDAKDMTLADRTAMAKRLNEVGPQLPKYIHRPDVERFEAARKAREAARPPKAPAPATKTVKVKPNGKTSGHIAGSGNVTLKAICAELNIDPGKARQTLRKAGTRAPGGRWEWPADQVAFVKSALVKS